MKTSLKLIIFSLLVFNPLVQSAQTILSRGSLNSPRASHHSYVLNDGRVLFFGGKENYNTDMESLNTFEIYDPLSHSTIDGFMYTLLYSSSVELNNNDILISGGVISYNYTDVTYLYNPEQNVTTRVADMNEVRYMHKMVKLKDGRILVAGGDNGKTVELYNPFLDTWVYTGELNYYRNNTLTLTLLEDGRVIAIGGGIEPYIKRSAEIYDPQSEQWRLVENEMNSYRSSHSSILLENGKVLIIGSNDFNSNKSVEIFDPQTEIFTLTDSLALPKPSNEPIILDNGKILVAGIGDYMTPEDSKIIEVYNTIEGVWEHNIYDNMQGSSDFSIVKLNDGRVLIAGGLNSYSLSVVSDIYTIGTDNLADCSYSEVTTTLDNEQICYGNEVTLSLHNCEPASSYYLECAGVQIAKFDERQTDYEFVLSKSELALGENKYRIRAVKDGCYSSRLDNEININVTLDNNDIPQMLSHDTVICEGESIEVTAFTQSNQLVWNSGDNTETIIVSDARKYFAYSVDAAGCESLPSEKVEVSFSPANTVLGLGEDIIVCTGNDTIQLNIATPLGGNWEGQGLIYPDMVDISGFESGIYYYKYHYCNWVDSLSIAIEDRPDNVLDCIVTYEDSICEGDYLTISINDADRMNHIRLYINDSLYRTFQGRNSYTYNGVGFQDRVRFRIEEDVDNVCSQEITQFEGVIQIIPQAETDINVRFLNDTVCEYNSTELVLNHPQPNTNYYYQENSSDNPINYADVITSDSLVFYVNMGNVERSYHIYGVNVLGCVIEIDTVLNLTPVEIYLNVDFYENGQVIGDTISVNYNTNYDICTWSIDSGLFVLSDSLSTLEITSNIPDDFQISLYAESRYGCRDTIIDTVHFLQFYNTNIIEEECNSSLIIDKHGRNARSKYDFLQKDNYGNIFTISHKENLESYCGFYLSKIDSNGIIQWQRISNISRFAVCESIVIDENSNIYLTGATYGTTSLFDYTIPYTIEYPQGWIGRQSFIAKIKSDGNVEWVHYSLGGDREIHSGTDICYLNDNEIYVSYYGNSFMAYFNNGEFSEISNADFFVIKINSDGEYIETDFQLNRYGIDSDFYGYDASNIKGLYLHFATNWDRFSGAYGPRLERINNDVVVYGRFEEQLEINGDEYFTVSSSPHGYFTSSISNEGNETKIFIVPDQDESLQQYLRFTWEEDEKYNCETDSITGEFYVRIQNDIIKYTNDGEFLWKYNFGGENTKLNSFVLFDNELYVVGTYDDFLILNETEYGKSEGGGNECFLAKITAYGEITGINTFGSIGDDEIYGMNCSNIGELTILGWSHSDLYFNNEFIQYATNSNFILNISLQECTSSTILPLNNEPEVEWIRILSGGEYVYGKYVEVDSNNNIYLVGNMGLDFIMQYDSDGVEQWSQNVGGTVKQMFIANDTVFLYGRFGNNSFINDSNVESNDYVFSVRSDGNCENIQEHINSNLTFDKCKNATSFYYSRPVPFQKVDYNNEIVWELERGQFYIRAMTSDGNCNNYYAGTYFYDNAEFLSIGGVREYLTVPCDDVSGICKVSNSGEVEWIKAYPQVDNWLENDFVFVDHLGNVNYIFCFYKSINIENVLLEVDGKAIAFVKYDSRGNLLNVNYTERIENWSSCTVDEFDNIYFAGCRSNIAILKYNSYGNLIFDKDLALGNNWPLDITVDNRGNMYLTTRIDGRVVINDEYLNLYADCCLLKIKDHTFDCGNEITPMNVFANNDTTVCKNEDISIPVNYLQNYYVDNSFNSNFLQYIDELQITPIHDETMIVHFQDSNTGCYTLYDSLNINLYPRVVVEIDSSITKTNGRYEVQLNAFNDEIVQYNWLPDSIFSDSEIANPMLTVFFNKSIILETKDIYGCSNQDPIYIDVRNHTDIEDVNFIENSLFVYPQPATSNINISVQMKCKSLKLCDVLGHDIFYTENVSENEQIKLHGMYSGIYYLIAVMDDTVLTKEIIVK